MDSVLITGGAGGIGSATAEILAGSGWKVFLSDIDADRLDEVVSKMSAREGQIVPLVMDASSEFAWQQARKVVENHGSELRGLVSNAFFAVVDRLHEQTLEQWNRQLAVSLTPLFLGIKTFHSHLESQRGSVVSVGSVHSELGFPGYAAYAAAKGGLVSMTRQISVEYRGAFRANTVIPGSVRTRVWDNATPEQLRLAESWATVGRIGAPGEVGDAIRFLLSPEASYINGTTITVDGGMTSWISDFQ